MNFSLAKKLKFVKLLDHHTSTVYDIIHVKYPHDDVTRLVSVSNDKNLVIWNTETHSVEQRFVHFDLLCCVRYSKGYLMATDWKGNMMFYQLQKEQFKSIRTKRVGKEAHSSGGCFRFRVIKDYSLLIILQNSSYIYFLEDFRKGKKWKTKEIYKGEGSIYANIIRLKTNKRYYLTGMSKPASIIKMDLQDMKVDKIFEEKHENHILSLGSYYHYDKDNVKMERIVCGSYDYSVSIWEIDGRFVLKFKNKENEMVRSLVYVAGGVVIAGGESGSLFEFSNNKMTKLDSNCTDSLFAMKMYSRKIGNWKLAVVARNNKIGLYDIALEFDGEKDEEPEDDKDLQERKEYLMEKEDWNDFRIKIVDSFGGTVPLGSFKILF